MQKQLTTSLWWPMVTTWVIVNLVNILQAAGFLSRILTGSRNINHLLGVVINLLALPAVFALIALRRGHANWRQWLGLLLFLIFVVYALVVDTIWPVEFRAPMRAGILVPYLVLFFGSIFLMGVPMFRLNRRLWFVTLLTTLFLIAAMLAAMRYGVG